MPLGGIMNRGKTAVMNEDYVNEIDEYLLEREVDREDVELIEGFRKFVGYEEVLLPGLD